MSHFQAKFREWRYPMRSTGMKGREKRDQVFPSTAQSAHSCTTRRLSKDPFTVARRVACVALLALVEYHRQRPSLYPLFQLEYLPLHQDFAEGTSGVPTWSHLKPLVVHRLVTYVSSTMRLQRMLTAWELTFHTQFRKIPFGF